MIKEKLRFLKNYLFLQQSELEIYMREQRILKYQNDIKMQVSWFRKPVHYLLVGVLVLLRTLAGREVRVISDRRIQTRRSVIYACTHIGGHDVETAFEAIKKPCYLFMGDPREVYRTKDGLMLYMNGVIFLDTSDKADRYLAKERSVSLLKSGGSLLIYPEGAWNITENEIVMPLFSGTAEMAIRSGADIVPMAVERYGERYMVAIGANISSNGMQLQDKYEMTDKLRNALAELKWEIWEKEGIHKRRDVPEGYSALFLEDIMHCEAATYTIEDVLLTRYRDKNRMEQEEVMRHLEKVTPSKENAFLWRGCR